MDSRNRTIEELNNKLREYINENNQLKIQLQCEKSQKEKFQAELDTLKSDSGPSLRASTDTRKLKLLEEERDKLKRENNSLWEKYQDSESQNQLLKLELEKTKELQKLIEKNKLEKKELQDKVNKLQEV